MRYRLFTLFLCLLAIAAASQTKTAKKMMPSGAPDRALMDKIWAGWSTLNPDNVDGFYAKGPHTFFDIAPLKYASWDEYQSGVRKELADYKTATCTVNDDSQVHPAGDTVLGHRDGEVRYDASVGQTGTEPVSLDRDLAQRRRQVADRSRARLSAHRVKEGLPRIYAELKIHPGVPVAARANPWPGLQYALKKK